ncbi:hypothetical protein [Thermococcus thioreducens]|uniref:Uncharacterized protein n=1 Tax=Thermococcus thioreducens TaxID=277988 RepID=A0A1I0NZH1_9EURY|nr:hypothetical protein [Thermococcus thioreducens]ASJ11408.1 hypothetical protein A3L14_00245 [Thermococcus thioreducens]SEW07237.1 hypothetical protein SAMN05216170_1390 [Thermococcus thioreducens]
MKLVVLKERGSTVALAVLGVFTILLIAVLAFVFISVSEGRLLITAFFAFFLLIMFSGLYVLMKKRGEYRRAESFAGLSGFSDSGLTFPEELEFETGTLEMRGYWVGSGRNRSYHVERNFLPGKRERASKVPFMSSPFKVAVSPDGTGFVKAPAVRITDEPYKNIVVLFFTDEGEVRGSGTVTVVTESDSAQVNYRGDGKFIAGTVYSTLTKARRVKVVLTAEGFEYEKVIGKGRSFEFRERMLPEEKVVMVGTYGTVTPRMVAKALGGGTVLLGHGEFIIRGVLDVRLRPDVRAEETFRVELRGEEIEKGREFEEEWGFRD